MGITVVLSKTMVAVLITRIGWEAKGLRGSNEEVFEAYSIVLHRVLGRSFRISGVLRESQLYLPGPRGRSHGGQAGRFRALRWKNFWFVRNAGTSLHCCWLEQKCLQESRLFRDCPEEFRIPRQWEESGSWEWCRSYSWWFSRVCQGQYSCWA